MTRMGTTAVLLAAALLGSPPAAVTRGHHGFGRGVFGMHGFGMHGGALRGGGALGSDQRHADDDYVKAASNEENRLLNTKIKSICRGL